VISLQGNILINPICHHDFPMCVCFSSKGWTGWGELDVGKVNKVAMSALSLGL